MTTLFQLTFRAPAPKRQWWFGLFMLVGLAGCCKIAIQDPETISKLPDLKERTLQLMGHGTAPYKNFKPQVKELLTALTALSERQKNRKKNDLSIQQWKLLLEDNPTTKTKSILPEFFNEWERSKEPLSKFFVDEKKKIVSAAFDEIIKLEKAKPLKCR